MKAPKKSGTICTIEYNDGIYIYIYENYTYKKLYLWKQ